MAETIGPVPDQIDQQLLAQQFVDTARERGVELVGPSGMLVEPTYTASAAEMSEHSVYDAHGPAGRDG